MDIRLIFRNHWGGAKGGRSTVDQPGGGNPGAKCVGRRRSQANPVLESEARGRTYGSEVVEPRCQEKPLSEESPVPVPQTDTGGQVEHTKANGKTLVKELGKLTP